MTDNNTITVTVKFFMDLIKFGPAKSKKVLPEGSNIISVLKKYKVPIEEKKLIILVNGIPKYNREDILKDGDIIAFFPQIAGG